MDNYAAIEQAEFIYVLLCSTSCHYVLLCNLFLNRFPGLHLLRVYCGLIKNHLAHNGQGDYLSEEHTCFDSLDLDVKKSDWMQELCDFRHLDTDQSCVVLFISTGKKVLPVPGSYIIKSQVTYSKRDVTETWSIKRFLILGELALKKAPVRNGEKTAVVILATAAKVRLQKARPRLTTMKSQRFNCID